MFTKTSRARTVSRIHNVILTEDQRREKFVRAAHKRGEHFSDDFLEQATFGGDGKLSGVANVIRDKISK